MSFSETFSFGILVIELIVMVIVFDMKKKKLFLDYCFSECEFFFGFKFVFEKSGLNPLSNPFLSINLRQL
jgi:hypothetical protein